MYLCVHICVCVWLCTSVCMCSRQRERVKCGVTGSAEIAVSMCAFECDSAHYEGITTLCVCLVCMCVCVCIYVPVYLFKCMCVWAWTSEVNKYWQGMISSGRVAGGFDGADWTQQLGKKSYTHANTYKCPYFLFLMILCIQVSPWTRQERPETIVLHLTKIITLPRY